MGPSHHPRLVLASASPRRRDLLRAIGVDPLVMPADVDERPDAGERPVQTLRRLARAKAAAVGMPDGAAAVLAADTGVILGPRLLGKPRDAADAASMLRALRGVTHHVVTAVSLRSADGRCHDGWESTAVRFRRFPDELLEAYARSDEPLDKAGAYAIQGGGALFCEALFGSWSNVVGLPIERLADGFARIGLDLERFRAG